MYRIHRAFALMALAACLPAISYADTPSPNQASLDTVWIVTAGILVFLMQAGFALLESGMSRAKNTVNIVLKNYADICLGSIAFWAIGFGLMFGANATGWFGASHFAPGFGADNDWTQLFFQSMFAATAATIASGALAERVRFEGYLIGSTICTAIIYPIYGGWAWGSLYGGTGWLKQMGFIDFAGSTVVHSVGAWVALAGLIVLGPRLGRFAPDGSARDMPGHNLPFVALGGFILWFGWFGFNGGSTGAAGTNIGLIVLNTHLAACAGAVGAMIYCSVTGRPLTVSSIVNGSIAGLVSITAGCASMQPHWALVTGAIGGVLAIVGSDFILRRRLDDVVGAVGVHGFCGAWGTLAAGLFFSGGLFEWPRVSIQLIGIAAAFLWAFPVALAVYWLIARMGLLRASTQDQQRGLDFSEHSEVGYPEFQRDLLHHGREEQ